ELIDPAFVLEGNTTERSIYKCYLREIENSQSFIYIENQYFISDLAGGGVKNRIARALLARIRRAILNKEKFRVIVILPIHPDGSLDASSVRYILKWQLHTICRGGTSLLESLHDEFPTIDLREYIGFFALRNYVVLETDAVDKGTQTIDQIE